MGVDKKPNLPSHLKDLIYPDGGMDDLAESFDTIEEALEYVKPRRDELLKGRFTDNHFHIFDCEQRLLVEDSGHIWNAYYDAKNKK